jgi:hypothetical protein
LAANREEGELPDKEKRRRDEPEVGKTPEAGKTSEAGKTPEDRVVPRAKKENAQAEKSRPSPKDKNRTADQRKEERDERTAASKLRVAESLRRTSDLGTYRKRLQEIVDKYPETEAGKKAAKLLE